MTDLRYPLPLLPLFIFIISTAGAQWNNNSNCPSYDCSGVLISYPFWRIDYESPTQFCGYEGFGINCTVDDRQQHPIIQLGGDPYLVKNISYDSSSIVLIDYDVSQAVVVGSSLGPDFCPRVEHNIELETLPLNFSMFSVNLSFHFNCSGFPDFATEISCLQYNETERSCAHIVDRYRKEPDWSVYSCDEEVVTTVFGEANENTFLDIARDFGRALHGGFELKWGTMKDCHDCEDSGGRCGRHNETGFMCFCSDSTTTRNHCNGRKGSFNLKVKLLIGFLSGGFSIIFMFVGFYFWRRRNIKRKRYYGSSYMSRNVTPYSSSMTDPEKNGDYHGVQIFKYRELEKATNYFDSANELGDGGFGTVYQGKLKDGRVVAVKRLYENNYKRVEQFMNEVKILAHLRHQNLVSLYGCTTHHSRELLLVYEYVPNGTVADHLHGEKSNPGSLTWTTRLNIAIETASALVYLHASDVIHRDVKTNNILLDNSFTVKVADFGLSRLFPDNVTHVSTAPQGTPGYVDPEYHECYQLTNKSDVYSFGVVLIELI